MLLAYGTNPDLMDPLGAGTERFWLRQEFPRYLREDGLANVEVVVDRMRIAEFRADLELQLEILETNLETQKWQAIPGPHCVECPSPMECPIPRHLRPDSQFPIDAPREQLEAIGAWIIVESDRVKKTKARTKAWAKENGPFRAGADSPYAFVFYDQDTTTVDHEGLAVAADARARFGTEFNPEDFKSTKTGVRYGEKKTPIGTADTRSSTAWRRS
jgi:hypothetical protein